MENVTKPFSEELYQHHLFARQVAEFYLPRRGGYVYPKGVEDYSTDAKVRFRGVDYWFELERRPEWNDSFYAKPAFNHNGKEFDTIHVPARKNKYLERGPFFYFVVSCQGRYVGIIHQDVVEWYIKNTEPQEVPNKYVPRGELFYDIPMEYLDVRFVGE